MLLEFGRNSKNRATFDSKLKEVLGDMGSIKNLERKVALEMRDLDSFTTEVEVREPIRNHLGLPDADVKVSLSKPNNRGLKLAVVSLGDLLANDLLKATRIKVGWICGRVRRRVEVQKCFRCLGYGYLAASCKGTDRSRLCFKCGSGEHKAKDCTSTGVCQVCAEVGQSQDRLQHVPGTRGCAVFISALEKAKKAVQ